MKTLVLILSTLCSCTAMAADWQEFYHSTDGSRHYINNSSIVSPGTATVRAWEKTVSANGKGSMILTEVDCEQRTYTVRAMEPLDYNDVEGLKSAEVAMKGWTEPEQSWRPIESTESREALYATWCGKKKEREKK